MQTNLKNHFITELEFSVTAPLEKDILSQIQDSARIDSDEDYVFFEFYDGHAAIGWLQKPDKKHSQSNINFIYRTQKGRKPKKELPKISQLIEILSTIDNVFDFECTATVSFPKKVKPKPIIQLPHKPLQLPDMPFDFIQGMHLTKVDGGKTKYEVFLDAPTPGEILENIVFTYSSRFVPNLACNITAEAINISERFVMLEQDRGKKYETKL
jgi:hypothetical protein